MLWGLTYFHLGDYARAIADYEQVTRIARRMTARGSLERTRRADFTNPYVYANLCVSRAALRQFSEAEAACRSAMSLSEGEAVFYRGFLKFMQDDYAGAWTDFDDAVRRDDTDAYALYGRGVAAVRLGRQAEGEAEIARAIEMNHDELTDYVKAGLHP